MSLTDDEVARLDEIMAAMDDIRGKLTGWNKTFFEDIEQQYEAKGGELYLSKKMWANLERIYATYT